MGFASLIFVSAKPLRQFGISGTIAALLALAAAFIVYPPFLRAARVHVGHRSVITPVLERFFTKRHFLIAIATLIVAVALAPSALRVNTDPPLQSYFQQNDSVRTGIEAVDRAGGSAPLDLVIADSGGQLLAGGNVYERLVALQHDLERHKDVGSVLSIALLMQETKRPWWYSFLFSWERRLDALDSTKYDRIGRTFLSEDRRHGRFMLRMREQVRARPRDEVIDEIEQIVGKHGFKTAISGGLYPLQGELSKLVEGSVVRGLGGLLFCFVVIVLIVTRSLPTALAMGLCLAVTPFTVFGLVGILKIPVDIISAPAANVALPLGIDEMIHLGYMVRRMRTGVRSKWEAWSKAIQQLWSPILISMAVVVSGFALFLLSSFPPTQRLGGLVCIGAVITDLVVLVMLPAVATWRAGRQESPSPQAIP